MLSLASSVRSFVLGHLKPADVIKCRCLFSAFRFCTATYPFLVDPTARALVAVDPCTVRHAILELEDLDILGPEFKMSKLVKLHLKELHPEEDLRGILTPTWRTLRTLHLEIINMTQFQPEWLEWLFAQLADSLVQDLAIAVRGSNSRDALTPIWLALLAVKRDFRALALDNCVLVSNELILHLAAQRHLTDLSITLEDGVDFEPLRSLRFRTLRLRGSSMEDPALAKFATGVEVSDTFVLTGYFEFDAEFCFEKVICRHLTVWTVPAVAFRSIVQTNSLVELTLGLIYDSSLADLTWLSKFPRLAKLTLLWPSYPEGPGDQPSNYLVEHVLNSTLGSSLVHVVVDFVNYCPIGSINHVCSSANSISSSITSRGDLTLELVDAQLDLGVPWTLSVYALHLKCCWLKNEKSLASWFGKTPVQELVLEDDVGNVTRFVSGGQVGLF